MKAVSGNKAKHAAPRAPLHFLGLACAIGVSTIYFNQPLLPDMARSFGETAGHAGFVAVATQVGYALGLLLFVPLLAGLMVMGDVLRHDALPLIASMVVSLVAVLLTTGGLAHFLLGDGLHEVSGDMVAGDMVAGDVVTGVEAEDAGRDRVERDYGKRGLDD